ncbi:hypothetical protein EDB86DRAFT_3089761 [Lactarius hatsudake]|nr:hypothetical protein EDB86DRAFT_3089761 [Lactarius hatsudake]
MPRLRACIRWPLYLDPQRENARALLAVPLAPRVHDAAGSIRPPGTTARQAGFHIVLIARRRTLLPIVVAVASSHAHASSGADREASIMLFVLERHALLHEDQSASGERACRDSLDDKKRWLSGIEKREVQIQILLHLLKLSLSGKCPCIPARPVPMRSSHAQKRRRAAQRQSSSGDDDGGGGDRVEATPRSILEDRLEGLMDRLVLWQMALPDAEASADGTKTVRDWTQAFCDDVVQPAFAQKLPNNTSSA